MTYEEYKKQNSQKARSEKDIQIACVEWFKHKAYPQLAPLLFHVNNEAFTGGKYVSKEAKERKGAEYVSMGVTAGVSDLILLCPGDEGVHHGLCIEMKNKTGVHKQHQKKWQAEVEKVGYRYELCRSVDQFKKIVTEYLGIDPADAVESQLERMFGKKVKVSNRH